MIYFSLFLETFREAQLFFVYLQNNEYCLCWEPRRELLQARKPKTIKWKEIVLHCLCGRSFAATIKLMFTTVKQQYLSFYQMQREGPHCHTYTAHCIYKFFDAYPYQDIILKTLNSVFHSLNLLQSSFFKMTFYVSMQQNN